VRTLLIAVGISIAIWTLLITILLLAGKRTAARELVTLVPNLVLLFRDLLRDPRVPRSAKIVLALGMLWLLNPLDLIPEFVPVLGPLDDAIVAALALGYLLRRCPPDVIIDHWRGERTALPRLLRSRAPA
jgi:uncharacterized membrane protein YkvA (DUF1232 family)